VGPEFAAKRGNPSDEEKKCSRGVDGRNLGKGKIQFQAANANDKPRQRMPNISIKEGGCGANPDCMQKTKPGTGVVGNEW